MTNERANNRDGDVKAGLLCLGGPYELDRLPYGGTDLMVCHGDDASHVTYELTRVKWNSGPLRGAINVWVLHGLDDEQAVMALGKAETSGFLEATDFIDPQWKQAPDT